MQSIETKCDGEGCSAVEAPGQTFERIRVGTASPRHVCGLLCRAKVLRQLADEADAAHAKALADAAKKDAEAKAAPARA